MELVITLVRNKPVKEIPRLPLSSESACSCTLTMQTNNSYLVKENYEYDYLILNFFVMFIGNRVFHLSLCS